MSVRECVLAEFEKNRGVYLSGEELASRLNVSRTAVWKAVKSLQEEGYEIEGINNRGYCLSGESDILSVPAILKYLHREGIQFRICKTLSSTNDLGKSLAAEGEPEGLVILAEEQSRGRGRFGRSFYSSAGSGLYMSILLRPRCSAQEALSITAAAAAAVSEAVEKVSGVKAEIKWVNDVYCRGRKICGILTEAGFDLEGGGLEYAVLGIGVNVKLPESGIPDELEGKIGYVFEDETAPPDVRNHLAAVIIDRFFSYYDHLEEKTFMETYRQRSFLDGKTVKFLSTGAAAVQKREAAGSEADLYETAVVLGIDEECRLLVRLADGGIKALCAGEVTLHQEGNKK